MFSWFCAAQIAMYHAATGRRDYERLGKLHIAAWVGKELPIPIYPL